MIRRCAVVVAVLSAIATASAGAQIRGLPSGAGQPPRPPVAGDTTRRDSTGADTTKKKRDSVKWAPADSVMAALMSRPGYTVTRYQGHDVKLQATSRELTLSGKAAVQREATILVGDTLVYNDSAKQIVARGDTLIVRDPTANQADVVAFHRMTYDLIARRGTADSLSTAITQGQTWYVASHGGGVFISDTTSGGHSSSYVRDGSITSCDLTEPHYHFAAHEIKMVSKNIMVARPAVLYIADIPVLWLPFIFQDMRSGRRSGIIPPRFGLVDIVRTSPTYRRTVENLGYYFALNDYADALFSLDWRSAAHDTITDPGWIRYNGEFRYKWLDRFMSGRLALTRTQFSIGPTSSNTAVSWSHQQDFSQRSHLNFDVNFVTSTTAQLQQALTVAQALATIASNLNFQNKYGPAQISLGGSRHQYVGRSQVDQTFPDLSVTTDPISAGKWLVWTPQFHVTNATTQAADAATAEAFRFVSTPTGLDSVSLPRNTRSTTADFNTPLRIFDYDLNTTFHLDERENDFPASYTIFKTPSDTQNPTLRVFNRTYLSNVDFNTTFGLPHFSQGKWNIAPSVNFQNADGSYGFLVRSERTGGEWVHQEKRPIFNLSASPTFFGLLPGFGPFTRIRHSINALVTFGYAPDYSGPNHVSDEFLQAVGQRRVDYAVGAAQQSSITLGINQVFEGKVRAPADSAPDAGQKLRILTLNTSPITYDFERARTLHLSGFTTNTFSISAASDLLPGFDASMGYSLFQGDVNSDSAKFKPFRTDFHASFHIGRDQNPFIVLARLLGHAPPAPVAPTTPQQIGVEGVQTPFGTQPAPIAGTSASRTPLGIPDKQGWEWTVSLSSSRQRPPTGTNVVSLDPTARCNALLDPIAKVLCINQARVTNDTLQNTTAGGPVYYSPPVTTLQSGLTFNLTQKWSAQWSTSYDFVRGQFSDQSVTLQRDLHDWRAIFSFLKAPNGNFAFTFFISLKAEPDLKFNYDRRTYRPGVQ